MESAIAEFAPSDALVGLYVVASLSVWWRVIGSLSRGEPPVQFHGDRASSPHAVVMAVVLTFAFLLLAAAFVPRPAVDTEQLGPLSVLTELSVAGVAWLLVIFTTPTRDGWGYRNDSIVGQVAIGVAAAAAALMPTFIIGLAAEGLGEEQEVVQLLRETASPRVWIALAISAVIGAPLIEEAMFRIVIQGFLTSRLRAEPAIAWTAMLFAGVHGWPAMVGLMPFALIIGYVYYQTRSAVAVVVMHMTFNASMLAVVALQVIEG